MNSFEADPTEPGAVSEPERLLQPVPEGRRITVMLAAFEGWNDAGEAASDALRYLNKLWGGKKVGAIDADEYYDFQFTRPTIRRTAAGERKIKWPSTRIFKASVPDSNVDVIFVQGTEPSYKWRAYTAELLVHAEALHVDYVILVGALLADVPHSRPIPVSTSTDDAALRERMDLEASQYEGPVGIVGVLGEVALLAGLPTVSLWAAVPHYVAQAPVAEGSAGPAAPGRGAAPGPAGHPGTRGGGRRVGTRRGRARYRGSGNCGVCAPAGGGQGHRRPPGGQRRIDSPRI